MSTTNFYKIALEALTASSTDMLFFKDENFVYMGGSKVFADMAGVEAPADIIGKTDYELFPLELANNFRADDTRVLESGKSMIDKIEPITEQGNKKRFSLTSKYILRDQNGNIAGLYGTARDVTTHLELRAEREMREVSRKMFDEILEADLGTNKMHSGEGEHWAKEISAHGDVSYSEALTIVANKFIHADFVAEFCRRFDAKTLIEEAANGMSEFVLIINQTVDGKTYRWVELTSQLHFSKITNSMHITTFLRDLDDEIRKKEELQIIAETDSLTGLYNRKSVIEKISAFLQNNADANKHVLLFIDLDKFKQINDNFGHSAGDEVITTIAAKIKAAFRSSDIVGRVGGDEFLVLLKNLDTEVAGRKIVAGLLESAPIIYADASKSITVTCSVGISVFSPEKDFEQMYAEADKAMYQAKQNGGNQLAFFRQ